MARSKEIILSSLLVVAAVILRCPKKRNNFVLTKSNHDKTPKMQIIFVHPVQHNSHPYHHHSALGSSALVSPCHSPSSTVKRRPGHHDSCKVPGRVEMGTDRCCSSLTSSSQAQQGPASRQLRTLQPQARQARRCPAQPSVGCPLDCLSACFSALAG